MFEDKNWNNEQWKKIIEDLIKAKLISWEEVSTLILGSLNPSQVGTSLASSKGFKDRYGKGNTMTVVMSWFYQQNGKCLDCNTRLELQADHIRSKETYDDPLDADFIENMGLRCRRCNVVRRPSHERGGETYLSSEKALMWLLFRFKPRTLEDYKKLCRLYGMTMADIRFQEAWAMAHWLEKIDKYEIDNMAKDYCIILWNDRAITRSFKNELSTLQQQHANEIIEIKEVKASSRIVILASSPVYPENNNVTIFIFSLDAIPFSHYFLDTDILPQALAIQYNSSKEVIPLPPRGWDFIAWKEIGLKEK